jgi:hypothetical protein
MDQIGGVAGVALWRKILSLIVAATIFGAGAWLAAASFLWFHTIYLKMLWAAGGLLALGGFWLWVDFIAPALGLKAEE